MPQRLPGVAPPFDEGMFLLHFNHAREAYEQGRFGEAREQLELAQRLRRDDPDVLNLLGLVYFKTGVFPEAEVIYRQLIAGNPSVFILHSNLGLILFKQGKLEEAESYLLRSVELRPNHAKSHLYLGLLYKQKGKYGLALEHLRFAGAEKAAQETEEEMRVLGATRSSFLMSEVRTDTAEIRKVAMPRVTHAIMPAAEAPAAGEDDPELEPLTSLQPFPAAVDGLAASRRLQEAVDDTAEPEERTIDLGRKIEGASRTFTLHENGFLEINFDQSVHVKRGTVSSYSGNLRFVAESGLMGTAAETLVRARGPGRIFLYEKGRKSFLLDLQDEFIYVEGGNLLALEDSLGYRVEPIYDTTYQRKIDTVKIFGRGSMAISTSIEPLTLRVSRQYPLSISSSSLVAWTGELIPIVMDDDTQLSEVMIEGSNQAFRIRFEGEGVVVAEQ
ncbi:MAG: tetratricopeptide repeat protein [Acidobacteriota bacterium]